MLLGTTWALLLSVAAGMPANAADDRARLDDPFEITADSIEYDGDRDLYVATGNVRVAQPERSLRADWVAFSTETRAGVAEGNVRVMDGGDVLMAEFMVFDVDSLQGLLYQGGLDAGSEGFRVRAAELVRTGENTFAARDAVFTTCRCDSEGRQPWQISAEEADVEVGGYGTIKNSTFDILGVPVLWIPWGFFPVKSDRESGFLLPEFELGGRSGFGVGLPFFWAAHPQVNVIATQQFYSERGYKQNVELEYVFGKRSEGDLFVGGLHDQYDEASGATDSSRWGVLWEHDQELPANFRWHTDIKAASDNFYSEDFNEFHDYQNFRFIESTTNVARSFGDSGGIGTMVASRFADDVQGFTYVPNDPGVPIDFVDNDDFILQRFAEGRADVQPGTVVAPFGIQARFDSEVIYFASLRDYEDIFEDQQASPPPPPAGAPPLPPSLELSNGRFYDIGIDAAIGNNNFEGERDGFFQPGEAIAERGTRVVLHPRIARVFNIGSVAELVPEIGWSQTLYKTDQQQFAERGLLTGRMELRSRFARDYTGENGKALRHVMEPQIGWAYVSERHQRGNPLFVPQGTVAQSRLRTLSLENVTRNPSDRIETANQVVLGLNQSFFRRPGRGRAAHLQATLRTAIDWDFAEEGLGNISAEARLFQIGPFNSRLLGSFDPERGAVDEGYGELGYTQRLSHFLIRRVGLSGAYRFRRKVPDFLDSYRGLSDVGQDSGVNQINLTASVQITDHLRLRYSTVYKLAGRNEFIRNAGTVEYVSQCRCWGVGVTVNSDTRDGVSGGVMIRFLGLGDDSSDLFSGGLGAGVNM